MVLVSPPAWGRRRSEAVQVPGPCHARLLGPGPGAELRGLDPGATHALMIHARHADQPSCSKYFPAAISRDDGQPLESGQRQVVTITVTDDEAPLTAWSRHRKPWLRRGLPSLIAAAGFRVHHVEQVPPVALIAAGRPSARQKRAGTGPSVPQVAVV